MRFFLLRGAIALTLLMPSAALAQSVYPTPQGRVTVPATVPLQCNSSSAACAPVTAANPVPVAVQASSTIIGNVRIDQTTPGTTNGVVAVGAVASGATDSGNPVKIGGRFNTTPPTLTDGQRGDLQLDSRANIKVTLVQPNGTQGATTSSSATDGAAAAAGLVTWAQGAAYNGATWDRVRGDANGLVVQPGLSSTFWNYAAASGGIVNTTTAVTIKTAAGAGVRNYVCWLHIVHDTLSAATEIALRDGAAGTVMWRGRLQTAASDSSLGAGSITFSPCLKGTANTLVEVVTLSAVTGGVYVDAGGTTGI